MGLTSWWHWVILLVVVLLLFGANRLPSLAKGVGQSLRIFKSEMNELRDDKKPTEADAQAAPQAAPQPTPRTASKDDDAPKV